MSLQKVATKSLSALKSRKEEIIDSLQDIVGKEATKKISVRTAERAASSVQSSSAMKKSTTVAAAQSAQKTVQQVQANNQNVQNIDSSLSAGQDYSLWTSKAFTPFVDDDNIAKGMLNGNILFLTVFQLKTYFEQLCIVSKCYRC